MIPAASIIPGAILANGKGKFRLVTEVKGHPDAAWRDVAYSAFRARAKDGKIVPDRSGQVGQLTPCCGMYSMREWSERVATDGERALVLAAAGGAS